MISQHPALEVPYIDFIFGDHQLISEACDLMVKFYSWNIQRSSFTSRQHQTIRSNAPHRFLVGGLYQVKCSRNAKRMRMNKKQKLPRWRSVELEGEFSLSWGELVQSKGGYIIMVIGTDPAQDPLASSRSIRARLAHSWSK